MNLDTGFEFWTVLCGAVSWTQDSELDSRNPCGLLPTQDILSFTDSIILILEGIQVKTEDFNPLAFTSILN